MRKGKEYEERGGERERNVEGEMEGQIGREKERKVEGRDRG